MVVIIYNRKKQVFLSFLKLTEKVMIEKVIVAFLFYGACEKQNTIFLLTQNADYTISYSNNINAGTVTVTIMERGSYEGTTGTTFQIKSRSIREVTVEKIGKSAVFFGG